MNEVCDTKMHSLPSWMLRDLQFNINHTLEKNEYVEKED